MFEYYGLDWMDAIGTVLGIYYLSKKQRVGFLLNAAGALAGLLMFLLIQSYPFILLNVALIALNLSGYLKWKDSAN